MSWKLLHEAINYQPRIVVENTACQTMETSGFSPSWIHSCLDSITPQGCKTYREDNTRVSIHGPLSDEGNISQIFLIVKGMRRLFQFEEPIAIVWYTCPQKKQKGVHDVLGVDEVNTGYTQFGQNKHIVIYRHEEFQKVLIHELIHFMEIDSAVMNPVSCQNLDRIITEKYRIITPRLGSMEAVCDLIAIWIYSAWHSRSEKDWADKMSLQISFCIEQAKKVMRYQKYSLSGSTPLKEDTHVFAYYVMKAAMMCDFALTQDVFNHAFSRKPLPNIETRILNALDQCRERFLNIPRLSAEKRKQYTKSLRMTIEY